jgi:hypothetical protein
LKLIYHEKILNFKIGFIPNIDKPQI